METTLKKRKSKLTKILLDLVIFGIFLYLLFLFLPVQLGGSKTYAILSGTSMEPNFSNGDLVVLKERNIYTTGDVILYRDPLTDNVFHRIVEVNATNFVLQGDNNNWVDAYRPTSTDIKGVLWIHIPKIGIYANKLKTPEGIAITSLILCIIVLLPFRNIKLSSKDEKNNNVNQLKRKK